MELNRWSNTFPHETLPHDDIMALTIMMSKVHLTSSFAGNHHTISDTLLKRATKIHIMNGLTQTITLDATSHLYDDNPLTSSQLVNGSGTIILPTQFTNLALIRKPLPYVSIGVDFHVGMKKFDWGRGIILLHNPAGVTVGDVLQAIEKYDFSLFWTACGRFRPLTVKYKCDAFSPGGMDLLYGAPHFWLRGYVVGGRSEDADQESDKIMASLTGPDQHH